MAGSDDFLTNLHHACVIGMSLWHLCSRTSGFEYILLHFIAEVSNPFLIMRTVFKIRNIKGSTFEAINKYTFAVIFIIARALVTPLAMIYIYEADKVIYGTKFGVAFVLFVQLFWVYRVLNLSAAALHEGFPDSKAAKAFLDFTNIFVKNKRVRNILAGVNFTLIFIIPHYYYGYVRQNLFNFSLD
ncbi:hypothetical protein FGO68_gene11598 [Halteria grandinella]|uniref:TLC domain-containing protein n=1 Tax=Halteria grandinella TaxID=5974 RepID=A0A8J8NMV9_HALGN|nr:hypothetical protein FGO68_gene11598 [Halteria grandinella]